MRPKPIWCVIDYRGSESVLAYHWTRRELRIAWPEDRWRIVKYVPVTPKRRKKRGSTP